MAEENTTAAVSEHMTGWKTKFGAFLVSAAGTVYGASELAPMPEMVPWIKFVAFIIGGLGGAFSLWGLGHKLEKNKSVLLKRIPYYIQKIDPQELQILKTFAESKNKSSTILKNLPEIKKGIDSFVDDQTR